MKITVAYTYDAQLLDDTTPDMPGLTWHRETNTISGVVKIRPAVAVAYERATGKVPKAGLDYLAGLAYYGLRAADVLPTKDGATVTFDQWLDALEEIGEDTNQAADAVDPT